MNMNNEKNGTQVSAPEESIEVPMEATPQDMNQQGNVNSPVYKVDYSEIHPEDIDDIKDAEEKYKMDEISLDDLKCYIENAKTSRFKDEQNIGKGNKPLDVELTKDYVIKSKYSAMALSIDENMDTKHYFEIHPLFNGKKLTSTYTFNYDEIFITENTSKTSKMVKALASLYESCEIERKEVKKFVDSTFAYLVSEFGKFFEEHNVKYNEKRKSSLIFVPNPESKKDEIYVKNFAEEIRAKCFFYAVDDSFMIWENGKYTLDLKGRKLRKMIGERLGNACKKAWKEEVLDYARDEFQIDRSIFYQRDDVVNCANGYYDLNTDTFHSSTPQLLTCFQVPVEYDPSAECPTITKFFEDVLPNDENGYNKDREALLDFFAYCLIPNMRMQKSLFLIGEGSNGKSVALALLQKLLEGVYASISLQTLSNNSHASAGLDGKLANIAPDIPSSAIYDSSTFKCIVGGDPITANPKYVTPYEFRPFARLIFSMNQCPAIPEQTDIGFIRRILFIQFKENFETNGKKDKNILNKLTTPEELSGFLNLLIKRLKNLRDRNFTIDNGKSIEDVKRMYILSSLSAKQFVEERCYQGTGQESKDIIYIVYQKYCKENNVVPVSRIQLNDDLKSLGFRDERCKSGAFRDKMVWIGLQVGRVPTDCKISAIDLN